MSINMKGGMFTSQTCEWATPKGLFAELNEEFDFTLDVCASSENHLCEKYFSKEDDSLKQIWTGRCWMNPPYGREIGKWCKKALAETKSNRAELVCCLVPSRTDTTWWHECCMQGEIRFIRGRLKFGGSTNSAPFPSAVVILRASEN
jgi:phage N-6-adenine-methyltransferase